MDCGLPRRHKASADAACGLLRLGAPKGGSGWVFKGGGGVRLGKGARQRGDRVSVGLDNGSGGHGLLEGDGGAGRRGGSAGLRPSQALRIFFRK